MEKKIECFTLEITFLNGVKIQRGRPSLGRSFMEVADSLRNSSFDVDGVYYAPQSILKIRNVTPEEGDDTQTDLNELRRALR